MGAVADRLRLLRSLGDARAPLVVTITALLLLDSLVPAATAVVLGVLVGRVGTAETRLVATALAPLGAFAVVLILGHLFHSATEPLFYLTRARIDGAHRARVARLASTSPTIDQLEQPQVQQLIRLARADPDNWTERNPADGALGQLGLVCASLGLAGSCAVLAQYAWWPIPILVAGGLALRILDRREARAWAQQWHDGIPVGMHGDVWTPAIASAGAGKETRIFGFGGYAVDQVRRAIQGQFEPVWALGSRFMRDRWRQGLAVAVPLTVTYVSVAVSAARGQTSVGVELAVFGAAWSLCQIAQFNDVRDIVGALATHRAFDRLTELLADRDETRAGAEVDDGGTGEPPLIEFEAVSFTYPHTDRAVLDRLCLRIRPGELLGIVGLNGAGKSTLIKLLAGLYTPDAGRITADGTDIAAIGAAAWRERISVVFQDFIRYELAAEDNVVLGHASVPKDAGAMAAAAADAGLDAVLDDLPDGWRTPLSRTRTGGVDLSGGQWQQVVLARALYALRTGARLLVLDEPTAHLDVRTEFDVFERLGAHRGDASVVLISHRLSTVRRADRIVLLDRGRIVEEGTHDELIARGCEYARMFSIQAERFRRGYDDRVDLGELV